MINPVSVTKDAHYVWTSAIAKLEISGSYFIEKLH